MPELVRLAELKVGSRGVIRRYDHNPGQESVLVRLAELGFVLGETVTIEHLLTRVTGALAASVQGALVGLGCDEASLLWVEVTP